MYICFSFFMKFREENNKENIFPNFRYIYCLSSSGKCYIIIYIYFWHYIAHISSYIPTQATQIYYPKYGMK